MADASSPGMERLCDELARTIASRDGGRTFRLMARMRRCAAGTDAEAVDGASAPAARDGATVGLWRLQDESAGRCYVRGGHDDWTLWADVERIEPRSSKPRVVVMGESVARGYFYDPHWNAVSALRDMLAEGVSGGADVVDLARTDIGIKVLLQLAESAVALRPDAAVMFAGNNWHPWARLPWLEARRIAAMLAAPDGWRRVRLAMEAKLQARVEIFVDTLATLTARHGVPFVLVIPEFNLADWEDCGPDVPMMPTAETREWMCLRCDLARARTADDGVAMKRAAEQMLQLDGGTMPVSLSALARVRHEAGDTGAARRLLECARDVDMIRPISGTPRCYTVAQDTLADRARQHGIAVVDLRRRFDEVLDGALPGRELFLDYCHLTARGLRIAMASVAECVAPLVGGRRASWREYLDCDTSPSPLAEASARLLAANHNYNWGQRAEILAHHCGAAIHAEPCIAADLRGFVDFHLRRAPALVCESFAELAGRGRVPVARYLNPLRSPKQSKTTLIDAIGAALEPVCPGTAAWIEDLRAAEHGVTRAGVNLLSGYCAADSSYVDETGGATSRRGYYRAGRHESRFVFVAQRSRPIDVAITYRLPASTLEDVAIAFNGAPAATLPSSPRWRTIRFSVGASIVRPGVNAVSVRWPIAQEPWQTAVHRMMRTIDEDVSRSAQALHPVYGEIAAFAVSTQEAREAS